MAEGGSVKVGDMVHARTGANVKESHGGTGLIIQHGGTVCRWMVLWSKTGRVQNHGEIEIQVVNESR